MTHARVWSRWPVVSLSRAGDHLGRDRRKVLMVTIRSLWATYGSSALSVNSRLRPQAVVGLPYRPLQPVVPLDRASPDSRKSPRTSEDYTARRRAPRPGGVRQHGTDRGGPGSTTGV